MTGPLGKALSWKLVPEHVYLQKPPPPSLIYGATHLLRLFGNHCCLKRMYIVVDTFFSETSGTTECIEHI